MLLTRETDLAKKGTKRLDIIKNIIEFGQDKSDVPISKFKEELSVGVPSLREYFEIIQYLSENPVDLQIDQKGRFTFITIKKKD